MSAELYVHVHTQFSLYLVDVTNKRVKRVDSEHPPTRRQGMDGNWHSISDANLIAGGVFFVWQYEEGNGKGTLTSPVQRTTGSSAAIRAWQELLDDTSAWKPV
jgi:hypothetical protein